MKEKILLPFLAFASLGHAEDRSTFISIGKSEFNASNEIDSTSLNISHFLQPRPNRGPLGKFDYLNTISNISLSYSDSQSKFEGFLNEYSMESSTFQTSGEVFIGNFMIGGAYSRYEDEIQDSSNARYNGDKFINEYFSTKIGYLINENFLVHIQRQVYEDFTDNNSDLYTASARYQHDFNDTDYLGLNFSTDENFHWQSVDSEYFMSLGNDRYISVRLDYSRFDDGNDKNDRSYLKSDVKYYFNQKTSVFSRYDSDKRFDIGAQYYITKNVAIEASYYKYLKSSNVDLYGSYFSLKAEF